MPARDDDVRSPSSTGRRSPTVKFPDFLPHPGELEDEDTFDDTLRGSSPHPLANGAAAGLHSTKRWPARKQTAPETWHTFVNGTADGARKHQKSLGEAIRTVRTRNMSMSENAHEIAESLKAPISFKLVVRTAEQRCFQSGTDDV